MGGLFVLTSSIRACHVVHLIGGVLYLDCPLMEVLLYTEPAVAGFRIIKYDVIMILMGHVPRQIREMIWFGNVFPKVHFCQITRKHVCTYVYLQQYALICTRVLSITSVFLATVFPVH